VPAPTAERLMRSRYSAFAKGERDYLLLTWHRSTRPATLALDPGIRWVALQILSRTGGSLLEKEGTVEFLATYRVGGTGHELRENSRFVKQDGLWKYLGATGELGDGT
jgi:SEC-C motif domain protein